MIDDEGNAYGAGQVSFVPDLGTEKLLDTGFVRIGSQMGLASCQVSRDRTTGYLVADVVGHRVRVPEEVRFVLLRALRAQRESESTPFTFALDLDGEMVTGDGEDESRQGLSDWRGSVTVAEGRYTVSISAALRTILPRADWLPPRKDVPIAEGDVPPRVVIEFSMDAITVLLRFGIYTRELTGKREAEPSPIVRTALNAMRLDTTPIGALGDFHGLTDDNKWVSIWESRRGSRAELAIESPAVEHRSTSGLMPTSVSRFPRIWFRGIDLDVVAAGMTHTRVFELTVAAGDIGYVHWHKDTADGPGERSSLLEATFRFELTLEGLVFNYSTLPGPLAEGIREYYQEHELARWDAPPRQVGKITVPWEVLIIRSPVFVRHREALLATLSTASPAEAARTRTSILPRVFRPGRSRRHPLA